MAFSAGLRKKRQWIILLAFVVSLAAGWHFMPLSLKYQIGKTFGIQSSALGTKSRFADMRGQPDAMKELIAEASKDQPLKTFMFPVQGLGLQGMVKQQRLEGDEKEGVELVVDGQKLLDATSTTEHVQKAAAQYPSLERHLYPDPGVFNYINVTTDKPVSAATLNEALLSGDSVRVVSAAQKISRLSADEAYPHLRNLLVASNADLEPGAYIYLKGALRSIGARAFPYYEKALEAANKTQSGLMGAAIAEAEGNHTEVILRLLNTYPDNARFRSGLLLAGGSRHYSREESKAIKMKVASLSEGRELINVMAMLPKDIEVDAEVYELVLRAIQANDTSVHSNTVGFIQNVASQFDEKQKTEMLAVFRQHLQKAKAEVERPEHATDMVARYQQGMVALGEVPDGYEEHLTDLLDSNDKKERLEGALGLMALGEQLDDATDEIMEQLSEGTTINGNINMSLMKLKDKAAPLVEKLVEAYEGSQGNSKLHNKYNAIINALLNTMVGSGNMFAAFTDKEREVLREAFQDEIGIFEEQFEKNPSPNNASFAITLLMIDPEHDEAREAVQDCASNSGMMRRNCRLVLDALKR
ncbi:MAG: hypothetical protein MK052_05860 [Alphaproteobacteria bacterium]|nr:hypothetical protein [Alphaproteobacteria bacterium]